MTKLGLALVVVVSVSGCGGKKKQPDCEGALANAMTISSKELKLDAATTAKIKDLSLARCKEDKWSGEALQCIAVAKTGGDLGTCEQKQTPDQRDKLKKALEAMAPEPVDAAGSAAEPAGSGSASGSAAAGSGSAATGSAAAGSGATGSGSAAAGSGAPKK